MAGWYAEHGCEGFYSNLWKDTRVVPEPGGSAAVVRCMADCRVSGWLRKNWRKVIGRESRTLGIYQLLVSLCLDIPSTIFPKQRKLDKQSLGGVAPSRGRFSVAEDSTEISQANKNVSAARSQSW